MLQHNILVILRNVKRFRTTFFINITGLSTGMACTVLIYLWVTDEWSFDRYHEKEGRLFQVMEHTTTENGISTKGHTQDFLGDMLASELPAIEAAVTVTPPSFFPAFTLSTGDRHVNGTGKYASQEFFSIFSYPLLQGQKAHVLSDRNAIVLSERMARRLFPDIGDIVGRTLEYQMQTLKKQVTITGVFRDVPANSSEKFDFVLSFDAFRDIMGFHNKTLDWDGTAPFFTYVTLREGANLEQVNRKIGRFLQSKTGNAAQRKLFLKPFSDNYLFGRYENGIPSGGRFAYVRLFSLVAAFILAIACINFMNLSTAGASRRIKEIGIKKAIGASRSALVGQYLGESLIMSFLSLAVALLIVDLVLPGFNNLTGKNLALTFDGDLITGCLCITLITGLLAGSYPALYLSGFNAARVLKGQLRTSPGEMWARRGLVIFQFALSVIFIVSVLVVYKQINFIQTKNLGFDRDNVLYFETSGEVADRPETFLSEIKKIPGVLSASSMLGNVITGRGDSPGGGTPGSHGWKEKEVVMNVAQVNYDLLETLGIKLVAGRSFLREFGSGRRQIIYNEASIEALDIENPVGKIMPDGSEVVGVAANFHFQSLHEEVQPHCFMLEPAYAATVLVKIRKGMEKETVRSIENFHKSFNPGYDFSFNFLDDTYNSLYVAEQRVGRLSFYFAALAILISCLGLLGLAAFTAERRTKEIGIRKVLGSTTHGIVLLLSGELTKIVLVSVVLALPSSYVIAKRWLDLFAFRIHLEWWYFLLAGLIALSIAWLTVGTQALKASRMNPTQCLRDE